MLNQRLLVLLKVGWKLLYLSLHRKPVKAVYKVKKSVNEKVNVVENKTASSPKKRERTFVPKP